MQHFQKLSQGIDVLPLLLGIKRRPELWQEDSYLRHYPQGPFGEVESIMLRFPQKVVFEGEDAEERLALYKANRLPGFDQHESIDYPAFKLLPEARPIIFSLMAYVQGERLGRVMVNKIKPGGVIYPHADTPEHAGYFSRFHVVLQSSPGVVFRAGNEKVYMETGSIWWFDNSQEHEVINNSADDRIHMVVDIRCSIRGA
jgi:hypothetical protein